MVLGLAMKDARHAGSVQEQPHTALRGLANNGKFLRPGEKGGSGNRLFLMSCPSTAGEKSIEDRAAAKHAKQI